MPSSVLSRPSTNDYAEYFGRYISKVPAGDLLAIYELQLAEFPALLARVSQERSTYRYAPGKWSVREVVGHVIDTERVFTYRATHFSRSDPSPLPSFDQEHWTPLGEYDSRPLADLVEEWIAVRRNSLALLRGLPAAALARRGVASENPFSTLAMLCLIPGHVQYHIERLPVDYALAFALATF